MREGGSPGDVGKNGFNGHSASQVHGADLRAEQGQQGPRAGQPGVSLGPRGLVHGNERRNRLETSVDMVPGARGPEERRAAPGITGVLTARHRAQHKPGIQERNSSDYGKHDPDLPARTCAQTTSKASSKLQKGFAICQLFLKNKNNQKNILQINKQTNTTTENNPRI